jgi:catechol 2,3-dioxygenase-like lactoylglutathione lyase family enzyme
MGEPFLGAAALELPRCRHGVKEPIDKVRIDCLDHVQLAMPQGGEALARSFYEGMLEIPEVPKPDSLAARGGCWFERGALKVHLGVEAGFRPARKAHPGFLVTGFAELCERLGRGGFEVRPEEVTSGPERAFVDDPFGNRIELIAAGG